MGNLRLVINRALKRTKRVDNRRYLYPSLDYNIGNMEQPIHWGIPLL